MEKKINYLENRKESYKTSSNVFVSFKYAFSGISYVLKTSRNFKIQLIFAVASLIIGFLLKISLSNYVILIATIMSVLILEILIIRMTWPLMSTLPVDYKKRNMQI